MKFKVGDKVKATRDVRASRTTNINDGELIAKGTKGKIIEVRPSKTYLVLFENAKDKLPMFEEDLAKRLF